MREVKATLKSIETRSTSIEVSNAEIKGGIVGLEGRIAGLDAKIGALPTTWTLLGIVFTTWALGSGILILAMNYARP